MFLNNFYLDVLGVPVVAPVLLLEGVYGQGLLVLLLLLWLARRLLLVLVVALVWGNYPTGPKTASFLL